ncbi:MAG: IBR domain-containing protein, partial [Hylemonella sp.]
MRELVSEQQLQRWRRFVANRDPNMRQCPNCDASQRGSAAQPAMTCTACGLQFCFAHSNAHPARTCADFERELLQQEREAMQVINAISVRCPGCQAAVEKASGCNHMRCPNCATYFCYLCGQRVSSSALPNHYAFWNLAGCPNRQMSESARPWSMCESVLYRLGYALLLLIFGPPALALTLCSMVLCCPLVCIGVRSSWNMEESQGVLRQDATPVARENGAGGDLQEVVVVASEEQLSTPAPATAKPAPPPQPSTCSK